MIQDISSQLMRSKTEPQVDRTIFQYVTIHYNGPSVAKIPTDLELLKADAKFHVIDRGWDGISYHFAAGRDGTMYQMRELKARLNHSGVPFANSGATAIFVCLGEGDVPTVAQLAALQALIAHVKVPLRYVFGHQEAPRSTLCPGAWMMRWLNKWRESESGKVWSGQTKYAANVRDDKTILSHLQRTVPKGSEVSGKLVYGSPVKGDSLWLQLAGTTDYIHASVLTGL